ncbi:MAG TPA: TerB family tellurite resistance protein [Phycisphaerales bacterium]
MTETQPHADVRALTALTVFAAFADGAKSDAERAKVRELLEGLGNASTSEAVRRVLLKQTTVASEASALTSDAWRQLAWESALAVCEADGKTSPAERAFLDELAAALGRSPSEARSEIDQADAITEGVRNDAVLASAPMLPVLARREASPASPPPIDPRDESVDGSVLRYAILTAAVELLPQNLATLAIIPLQTKMVYGIGTTYGHTLGASSIKEFLATIGIGMTGQVVEQYARKVLGKFAGGLLGGSLGGIGRTATSWGTGPVLTFATTYAIGMVAKQYYRGGRQIGSIDLRSLFESESRRARSLYEQYEPQVRETAARTNPGELLRSLRA